VSRELEQESIVVFDEVCAFIAILCIFYQFNRGVMCVPVALFS
jgi:hypothetical protein